ncbi:hypothetical protein LTR56_016981 [Elasticomyces elasticus]|nr:hypothetical protein LTR56_016981 [Elasticomyces elasticus]KAK3636135.1 hypothetical protein LTR22_018893 [Elasticomyces elasticus]KAK4912096.1 hypothetical protein LTR49_019382 [Elasticomyces elasticus]KAK5753658.1 hypothetical protein LTS12_016295 [Elasticomyces elasticus]
MVSNPPTSNDMDNPAQLTPAFDAEPMSSDPSTSVKEEKRMTQADWKDFSDNLFKGIITGIPSIPKYFKAQYEARGPEAVAELEKKWIAMHKEQKKDTLDALGFKVKGGCAVSKDGRISIPLAKLYEVDARPGIELTKE